jgi:hypothetical protein
MLQFFSASWEVFLSLTTAEMMQQYGRNHLL